MSLARGRRTLEPLDSGGGQILKRGPLGEQLLMAHQLVAGLFVGLGAVLLAQGQQLLAKREVHRMVLVHRVDAMA